MKFDFDKYPGKYVMHCKTEEEAKEFCKVMHDAGRKWNNGELYIGNTDWNCFKNRTTYSFNNATYGPVGSMRKAGYKILEWSDFGKEKESAQVKSHEHKFVVDRQRGFKTIYINGVTIAVPIKTPIGIAIKNPNDEYDEERGRSLAYYRMEGQE